MKQKRAVLVMFRGSSDQQVECGDVLNKVVAKVDEAKSEFCNSLKGNVYIVGPDDLKQTAIPEANQLQLFKTTNIQEVLLRGSEGAVSRDGKGFLPSSDLICLQTQTSWSKYELCVFRCKASTEESQCSTTYNYRSSCTVVPKSYINSH